MGLFASSAPSLEGVLEDLKLVNDSKPTLMQKYSDRQAEILNGRTISDLPIEGNEEYYILGEKKRILNGLPT